MALAAGTGVILLVTVFILKLATMPPDISLEESLALLLQGNRRPGRLMETWIRPLLPGFFLFVSAPLIALAGYALHSLRRGERRNALLAFALVLIISLTAAGSLVHL